MKAPKILEFCRHDEDVPVKIFVIKPLAEADKCIWLLKDGNCDLDKKPKKCTIFRYKRMNKNEDKN